MNHPIKAPRMTPEQYGYLAAHEDVLAARAEEKSEAIYHTYQAAQYRDLQLTALSQTQFTLQNEEKPCTHS